MSIDQRFPPITTAPVTAPVAAPVAPPVATWRLGDLSLRERQVLVLITHGLSNAEIAQGLFLSINSVKTYIRTGYRKIGATRRTQAMLWGMRNGLADIHLGRSPISGGYIFTRGEPQTPELLTRWTDCGTGPSSPS